MKSMKKKGFLTTAVAITLVAIQLFSGLAAYAHTNSGAVDTQRSSAFYLFLSTIL